MQWISDLNTTINRKLELIKDINDFNISKNDCLNMYTLKTNSQNIEPEETVMSHITNDIFSYLNENCAICDGCVPKFYNTFRRLYQNTDKDNVNIMRFFLTINKIKVQSELNILWGLLYPHERKEFVAYSQEIPL